MLPINIIENCKRMIEFRQYQLPSSRGKEDLWLCKYLKDKKYSKEDAYNIWLSIYQSKYGNILGEDYEPDAKFSEYWNNCDKVRLRENCNVIVIYQEELDFINSTNFALWEKQYMLLLSAYCKARNKTDYVRDKFPPSELKKMVVRPKRKANDFADLYNKMVDVGFLQERTIKTFNQYDGEYDTNTYVKMHVYQTSGTAVIKVNTILDISMYFDKITMHKKCKECGQLFEYHSKTQRDVCEKCYKKQRLQKQKDCHQHQSRKNVNEYKSE